jgi:hypothetical protein
MPKNAVQLVLSREQSTMVSTWCEKLCLVQESDKLWRIGTFVYEWIGSIYDLVPEDQRYSDEGELVVPETWEGKKIIGLVDGEYLQTDELVTSDDLEFTAATLKKAREFCKSRDWTDHPKFDLAWLHIETSVKPSEALSKRRAFKGMPLLRVGSSASLSGYCTSELAVYRGQVETEFWVWNSESECECLHRTEAALSFGQIVRTASDHESFNLEIDWDDLEISGLSESEGIVFASSCAFDEGSKAAARLIAKIPDQTLIPFLNQVTLDGIELGAMGQQLLDYAIDHDISLDDIESLRPRRLHDFQSLEKSLMGALLRASRRRAQADSLRQKRLSPFEADIDRLVDAYRKDKPKRKYPTAGYVVPPLGVHSLRQFLQSYALENQALPKGKAQVPYADTEMGKPPDRAFTVDFDVLGHE